MFRSWRPSSADDNELNIICGVHALNNFVQLLHYPSFSIVSWRACGIECRQTFVWDECSSLWPSHQWGRPSNLLRNLFSSWRMDTCLVVRRQLGHEHAERVPEGCTDVLSSSLYIEGVERRCACNSHTTHAQTDTERRRHTCSYLHCSPCSCSTPLLMVTSIRHNERVHVMTSEHTLPTSLYINMCTEDVATVVSRYLVLIPIARCTMYI